MVRDFIKLLGGPSGVADALNRDAVNGHKPITDKAVIAWGMRDTIPWRWRPALAEQAHLKALSVKDIPDEVKPYLAIAAE